MHLEFRTEGLSGKTDVGTIYIKTEVTLKWMSSIRESVLTE